MTVEFLPPGNVVDLTNCDREPIHIPGSIQPNGYLLAVDERSMTIVMASQNAAPALGRTELLGVALVEVFAEDAAQFAHLPMEQLHAVNPISIAHRAESGEVKELAVVHRSGGLLIIEIEPQTENVPPSNAVRRSVLHLASMDTIGDLLNAAALEVRTLSGFDRVMIYRFDDEWNGEVVAEQRREDLEPFFGLHYPASDIPSQARELYRRNWIRCIPDIGYTPCPIEPVDNPLDGTPLDLSDSILRSVSPIHVEYLQNMGVTASMSISLIVGGNLWGLIACHHYSGPHVIPFQTRLDSEFLGQALSLQVASVQHAVEQTTAIQKRSVLDGVRADLSDIHKDFAWFVATHGEAIGALVDADGVAIQYQGRVASFGLVPGADELALLQHWWRTSEALPLVTDRLTQVDNGLDALRRDGSGVIAYSLSPTNDDFVAWFRQEYEHTVSWGGNPDEKKVTYGADGAPRLSPRGSFELWKTTVSGRSQPWNDDLVRLAEDFARDLINAEIKEAQDEIRISHSLQRSLLPAAIAPHENWNVETFFESGGKGRIGGDWFDVVTLDDGTMIVIVGDVAGHGIEAASMMGQLRSGVRAYLYEDPKPSVILRRLNAWMARSMPEEMATCIIASFDNSGRCTISTAGHLPPIYLPSNDASLVSTNGGPSLGLLNDSDYEDDVIDLNEGGILFYTDGLIERRDESIDTGIERLRQIAAAAESLDALVFTSTGDSAPQAVNDDITVVKVCPRP